MTRERLYQYQDLAKEAKQLEEHVAKLQSQIELRSVIITDLPKGQRADKEKLVLHLVELKKESEKQLNKVLEERLNIEKYINNLKDTKIRQITRNKIIKGLYWYEISREINYSESYVKKLFYEYDFSEKSVC